MPNSCKIIKVSCSFLCMWKFGLTSSISISWVLRKWVPTSRDFFISVRVLNKAESVNLLSNQKMTSHLYITSDKSKLLRKLIFCFFKVFLARHLIQLQQVLVSSSSFELIQSFFIAIWFAPCMIIKLWFLSKRVSPAPKNFQSPLPPRIPTFLFPSSIQDGIDTVGPSSPLCQTFLKWPSIC